MALLAEYAITPDVFDMTSYNSEEFCSICLQTVKEVMLNEGLVRNLRCGEWEKLFSDDHRPWHRKGKELLKKLIIQRRLVLCGSAKDTAPKSDIEWCEEALLTHRNLPLSGIIITNNIAEHYGSETIVATIDRLSSAPWWAGRSPSLRLNRCFADYCTALHLILRHANSIMFIDPHIDPTEQRYKDLVKLIQIAGGRASRPLIEIHRVCYRGSGPHRQLLDLAVVEANFKRELSGPLVKAGLIANIFIWDDFHDRYLISDLVGINIPYGFDTTKAPDAVTTWSRLGRVDRDDIQREFDPASGRHKRRHIFTVP